MTPADTVRTLLGAWRDDAPAIPCVDGIPTGPAAKLRRIRLADRLGLS